MQRLHKEYHIDYFDSVSLTYGSVNRCKPDVIYIIGRTWLEPKVNECDFNIIKNLLYCFKHNVKQKIFLTQNFAKNFIFDFDINLSNKKNTNRRFLNFEFYIKQQNKIKPLQKIRQNLNDIFYPCLIELISELNKNFQLSKSK